MVLTEIEKQFLTPEEYLELEGKAEFRNEYRDGKIIPMSGGTANHNRIAGNFYKRFPETIQGLNYEIYINIVRLWIPAPRIYTYPDVMIVRGKPNYVGKGTATVTNPCVILEVVSKSTREYDRSDKFKFYRSIPTLQEYITVDQDTFYAEQYVRQDRHRWLMSEFKGENSVLSLATVEFQITFADLYQRVDLDTTEEA